MYSIPLRAADMMLPGPGGQPRAAKLDYADTIREVLLSAPPGRGVSTAEAMKGFEIWLKVSEQRKNELVMLEDADYAVLKARLESFTWAYFTEACAEFVRAVRDASIVPLPFSNEKEKKPE
jgi:hypothetical protein